MGGTSTDVSRYSGRYEHVFEATISGVTIQAPQLDVNTVAAGGGSRLFFRRGIFVVGPESAGAHPGPVCYRKVRLRTDCRPLWGDVWSPIGHHAGIGFSDCCNHRVAVLRSRLAGEASRRRRRRWHCVAGGSTRRNGRQPDAGPHRARLLPLYFRCGSLVQGRASQDKDFSPWQLAAAGFTLFVRGVQSPSLRRCGTPQGPLRRSRWTLRRPEPPSRGSPPRSTTSRLRRTPRGRGRRRASRPTRWRTVRWSGTPFGARRGPQEWERTPTLCCDRVHTTPVLPVTAVHSCRFPAGGERGDVPPDPGDHAHEGMAGSIEALAFLTRTRMYSLRLH